MAKVRLECYDKGLDGGIMPRAIFKNGGIQPLDPWPTDWREGQEVIVEPLAKKERSPEELERYFDDLEALCAAGDEEDDLKIQAALQEAHLQAKEMVRKSMGLK